MDKYDLVVVGGGPGGYVAAIRAAQLGQKTAIVEQDRLGGICLNWGCIPTKALLKNAEVLHYVKNSRKFGLEIPEYKINFQKTIKRSRDVALRLSKGVEFLMKKNQITHIPGRGVLESKHQIAVTNDQSTKTIEARKIILATGGHPKLFPGFELDGKRVLSYKEAMVLETIPRRMLIIGAGAIGVEFAYFYNEFGSEVHLIEMLPRILPVEDEDVSREIEKSFKKSGIKVHTNTSVTRIQSLKSKVKVYTESDEAKEVLEGDVVLVATGVTGNVENLGLETVGVEYNEGAIQIDEFCRTSVEDIYAIGDVTGPPWLAHVASAQGHVAVEHAFGKQARPLDYSAIPGCTYCQPQVGSIGLTEQQAREQGYDVKVGRFDFRANGRAMAAGETIGFVKIIFDGKYGELLGCHIVATEATEMIAELGIAKTLETTWRELAMTVHAHPTLSEAVMEAALDAYGESVHQ